jgi:hypothetical protein
LQANLRSFTPCHFEFDENFTKRDVLTSHYSRSQSAADTTTKPCTISKATATDVDAPATTSYGTTAAKSTSNNA